MPQLIPNLAMSTGRRHIEFEVFKFNDGSVKVSLQTSVNIIKASLSLTLSFAPANMTDAIIAAQMVSIVKNLNPSVEVKLQFLTTLYTRYDRVMHQDQTDAFGLKIFIESLTPLLKNIDEVLLIDIHNPDVLTQLLLEQNKDLKVLTTPLPDLVGNLVPLSDYYIVAPDKGAENRFKLDGLEPDIIFSKRRDPVTGKLLGFEQITIDTDTDKPYLIIDDICENGGTFLNIANLITPQNTIALYVTYGVLPTDNAIKNLADKFDKIYIQVVNEHVYARIKCLISIGEVPPNKFVIGTVIEKDINA